MVFMNANMQQKDAVDPLAPYAPPQTEDAPIPLDADGVPVNFRDIALLVRKAIYKQRIATLFTFVMLFFVAPVTVVTTALVFSWINADAFTRDFEEVCVFFSIIIVMLITASVADSLAKKEIKELNRKSGYNFPWFIVNRPDPVSYAVKLLRQAGYRANRLFLPDMAQFDPPKEDSHED